MAPPNPEKGARYLAQLDSSLCAGAWADIAEHARKIDKHAPDRTCLTLAARCEAQIASASHRPESAPSSTTASIHSLGDLIPKLQAAIGAEKKYAEDAYAARVCLAEIHRIRGSDGQEALRVLEGSNRLQGKGESSAALGWLEVCEVREVFIRGSILETSGESDEAHRLYVSFASRAPGSRTVELRRWTERVLARACMSVVSKADYHAISWYSDALCCFQAWSDFWQRVSSPDSPDTSHLEIPRRTIWRMYYELLSRILDQGLIYAPAHTTASNLLMLPSEDLSDVQLSTARLRQRKALRQVESTYESLLLNETQFPKASQANTEVEEWVERVIGNWKIFCGSQWTAAELGDGGQAAVSRSVLDILYRASTKTFHSTALLRQLFTVHSSLGEFDLAIHAFDSYLEIVSKGKTRAEKTGKHEIGFDSDDLAVCTAAEAVKVLCQFGDREQAEKANEIIHTLRKWLVQKRPGSASTVDTVATGQTSQSTETGLQPKSLAAAYRAIGVGRAHWARVTFDDDAREQLRADAIKNLRRALAQNTDNVETSFALALTLAESLDIAAATQVIKSAVAASEPDNEDEEEETSSDYQRERQLMPLWHLLALCRSADEGYEQAAKMCEAAFEQYGDSSVLFGERGLRTSLDSEQVPRSARGVVDQLDALDKTGILQLKMTQLSLIELMEGADVAVKSSEELLALYTRLFGSPTQPKVVVKPPPTASTAPPSRSGGALRNIAGSIRPRSRSRRRSVERQEYRPPTSIAEKPNSAVSTNEYSSQTGAPIAITVTNEDGVSAEKHHKHLHFKLRGHHHDGRSLRSARSIEYLNEKDLPSTPTQQSATTRNDYGNTEGKDHADHRASPVRPAVSQSEAKPHPASPEQAISKIPHNVPASDTLPPPTGHKDQPPRQDVRLPAPHPASHSNSASQTRINISGLQERRHRISLLVEVWLFIAGLYLRAEQFDDCGEAVEAARRLVEGLEEEVASDWGSSARGFSEKGWGLGRSVDGLWGDVWAAVSFFLFHSLFTPTL